MSDITKQNKAKVYAYFDNISRNDIAAATALFAEDGRVVSQCETPLPSITQGRAAIKSNAEQIVHIFPNGLRMIVHSTTAEDDRVSAEVESVAVHVSGKHYNNKYHFLVVFENGLIKEMREYLDNKLAYDVIFSDYAAAKAS